ncbi:hypothetical protein PYW08_013395 [Mythimna loreyi]|uniref:Uncharacterized protein n=1 Tax=Mythimna loreyi TaxID=667449 RepID=A0ACC2QI17_9NEOP|nr:hypothetical protein PYW08_013395 [Mythimna loreyi]
MQRIISIVKTLSSVRSLPASHVQLPMLSTFQQFARERLLQPSLPMINSVCGFKVKGRLRRRCKSCYFVVRDERLYVICPKSPRHKQMAMKPKPLNTYILTHASQSPVRPW